MAVLGGGVFISISPGTAGAQNLQGLPNGYFFQPLARVNFIHDSNLFFGSEPLEADYLRFTPNISGGYRSSRLMLAGGATFAGESFRDRPDFSQVSRKQVSANLDFASSRRTRFSFGSSFTDSVYPSDFDEESGIEVGRRPVTSFDANAALSTQPTRRQQLDFRYTFGRAELEELVGASDGRRFQSLRADWRISFSSRTMVELGYQFRWFSGSVPTPVAGTSVDVDTRSHTVAVGLTRLLGRRTSIAINGGPRFTRPPVLGDSLELSFSERLAFDLRVTFRHNWPRVDFSTTYAHQQNPAFNVAGFVNTDTIGLAVSYRPTRRVTLSLSPGAFRNRLVSIIANSYRARAEVAVFAFDWLSLGSSYEYVAQERLAVPLPGAPVGASGRSVRNLFMLSMTIGKSLPIS